MRDTVTFTVVQLNFLKKAFPELVVTPTTTIEEIMFAAGRTSLLKFIERNLQKETAYEV